MHSEETLIIQDIELDKLLQHLIYHGKRLTNST